MSASGGETAEDLLSQWRQGDYALDVGGHLFADVSQNPEEEPYSVSEASGVVGLMVISQTCDVVRPGGYVTVCALVRKDASDANSIKNGRRPSFLDLECPPEVNVYADLSRVMTVSKDLLISWTRHRGRGFVDERQYRRLASALERKFGRFAFPGWVGEAFDELRSRAWSKHSRDSDLGKIYRSIREIRLQANWNAEQVVLSMFIIVHDAEQREIEIEKISAEISGQLSKISLPERVIWNEPEFEMGTATNFSARDIFESQALDFQYLSA